MKSELDNSMTIVYRFRDTDKLLDEYHELENQTIHFSPLECLNDPMEGYLNLFFKGDRIVWENLFFHYIVCIDDTFSCMKTGIDIFAKEHEFPLFNYDNYFDGPHGSFHKSICEEAHNKLIKFSSMQAFIAFVATGQKISLLEIQRYLKHIHFIVLRCYLEAGENKIFHGDTHFIQDFEDIYGDFERTFSRLIEMKLTTESFSKYLTDGQCVDCHDDLQHYLDMCAGRIPKENYYLFKEFPAKFLKQLSALLWHSHYIACFSKEITNPTLWAHYANSHKGVCLVFNTKDNGLYLETATSIGGSKGRSTVGYSPVKFTFENINYDPFYPEVDFFQNLGTITVPQLSKYWYSNKSGVSSCFNEFFENGDKWRENYHKKYSEVITTKLKDWEYEKELRLIYENGIVDTSIPKNRTLQYSFDSLEGIVFGINTALETKIKIAEIIREKCKKVARPEFCFFQAFYDSSCGKIGKYPLRFTM